MKHSNQTSNKIKSSKIKSNITFNETLIIRMWLANNFSVKLMAAILWRLRENFQTQLKMYQRNGNHVTCTDIA